MIKNNTFCKFLCISSWVAAAVPWLVYFGRFAFLLQPEGFEMWRLGGYAFFWPEPLTALYSSVISFAVLHSLYLFVKKYICDSQA